MSDNRNITLQFLEGGIISLLSAVSLQLSVISLRSSAWSVRLLIHLITDHNFAPLREARASPSLIGVNPYDWTNERGNH